MQNGQSIFLASLPSLALYFNLVPDLLFDCSCVLEYAKIRTVLQSKKTVPNKPFYLEGKILKLFWEAEQIEICAACHIHSDGLCYMWNNAEWPLDIYVCPFLLYNICKNIFCQVLETLTQQANTSMFNFSACLTEHCIRGKSAWLGDREIFFTPPKLNVSRLRRPGAIRAQPWTSFKLQW